MAKQKEIHKTLYFASIKLENLLDATGESKRPFVEAVQQRALGVLEAGIDELEKIINKEKSQNTARQVTKI
jgi:hypothetical protein